MGCYEERSRDDRIFKYYNIFTTTLTHEVCISHCDELRYRFAGLQFGRECFCSNERPPTELVRSESECSFTCSGDRNQKCGAWMRMNVYEIPQPVEEPTTLPEMEPSTKPEMEPSTEPEVEPTTEPEVEPTTEPEVEPTTEPEVDYTDLIVEEPAPKVESGYLGCYREEGEGDGRALQDFRPPSSGDMTKDKCKAACEEHGYKYYGVENWSECYCGNTIHNEVTNESECNTPCGGNMEQTCGGFWRISIYKTDDKEEPAPKVESGYLGCYREEGEGDGRALQDFRPPSSGDMTKDKCKATCEENGYKYYGVENWSECYCGNTIHNEVTNESECNTPCGGNMEQTCGGFWRISIYKTDVKDEIMEHQSIEELDSASSTEVEPPTVTVVKHIKSLGCFVDENGDLLYNFKTVIPIGNSPCACMDICLRNFYQYAGVSAGDECYCGKTKPSKEFETKQSQCGTPCSGDASKTCGGAQRIEVYPIF